MKKSKRVLAGFLALLLVLTSFTWDFGNNVVVANAENATTTESVQPEKINFDNIDVTTLNNKFTAYVNKEATPDSSVELNWFSGKTGDNNTAASNVEGLKPKKKGSVYCLVYNETYQNFKATIEMYPDTNTQVGVGNLTSSSINQNSGAVMFWFSDNHTIKYQGAGKATATKDLQTKQSVFTLHIRVENRKLTAWIDGTDFYTSFDVNSAFPNKSNIVFRQQRNSDGGVGGGYKSFEVRNLDAAGYTDFDYVNVSSLTDFKATQLKKSEKTVVGNANQAASALWYSGRTATVDGTSLTSKSAGIKPKAKEDKSYIHLLNYKDSYENFRTTVEIYKNDNIGVVIGERNSCPNNSSSEKGVRLWIVDNTIALQGALDWSDYTYKLKDVETNTTSTENRRSVKYADSAPAYGAVVKLNLEVKDGYLKVWVSGYDMSLKVKLSSSYPAESTVALWSVNYNNNYSGGFKSFAFQDLDATTYNLTHVDVSTLTDFTATQLKKNTAEVVGSPDQPVSALWFSGNEATVSGGTVSGRTGGLKAKAKPTDTYDHLLNYKNSYENFQVSTEINFGAAMGIRLGAKNTFPADATSPSIYLSFIDNGTIQFKGAFDGASGVATGTSNPRWVSQDNGAYYLYRYVAETSKPAASQKCTLNIKMQDGVLTVWVSEYDTKLTVNVTEDYPEISNIALWSRNYDSTSRGFRTFSIKELPSIETGTGTEVDVEKDGARYTNFDNVKLSLLKEEGFTSTKYRRAGTDSPYVQVEGSVDIGVKKHWRTSENGLKIKANSSNDNRYYLNTPYTYENFKISTEVYLGQTVGVALGEGTASPSNKSSGDTSVVVYFSNNQIYICGAVDPSDRFLEGTNGASSTLSGKTIFFTFDRDYRKVTNEEKTLHVEMLEGILSVWVEGYDGKISVPVTDEYQSGNIALLAQKSLEGGFKTFSIQELQAAGDGTGKDVDVEKDGSRYTNFVNADPELLKEKGFTSTKYKRANGDSAFAQVTGAIDVNVTKHWKLDNGVKTKVNSSENRYYLNTPYTYENFKISTEVYLGQTVGVALGEDTVSPSNKSDGDTSVVVYFSGDRIYICGAVDAADRSLEGTNGASSTLSGKTILFTFDKDYKKVTNEAKTLHVEMLEGILSVWVEGYDGKISVPVTDEYKSGNIALLAQKASEGGFKTFSIQELQVAGDGTGKEVDVEKNGNRYTNFVNADPELLKEKGFTSTKYRRADSDSVFAQVTGAIDVNVTKHWKLENGIKTKTNSGESRYYLNTPYSYENFKISTDVYLGQTVGVALGEDTVSPSNKSSEDTSVVVYFYNNHIYICGAIDTTDRIVTGTNGASSSLSGKTILFTFDKTYKMEKNEVKTLHVEMLDGILSVWVDGYDGKISVPVTEKYQSGNIALLAQKASEGGFKTFSIQELQASQDEDPNGFTSMQQVEEMFDAYYLKNAKESSKMEKVNLEDHWFLSYRDVLSRKAYSAKDGYTVVEDVEVLTYTKKQFTDFEMTYTYQQVGERLGVVIGEDLGEYPLSYTNGKLTADKGAVIFIEAEGYSNVQGHLNNTNVKDSLLYRVKEPTPDGFAERGANISARKLHTVKIVVKDKALYIFLDGSAEPACYTHLGDNYKGGYVSLISHAPTHYGFKSFAITDKITTRLPAGGGVSISGDTVTVDFNSAKFDDSKFETYYLEKTKQNADGSMEKQDFEDQWTIDNGVLESNNKLPLPGSDNLTEFEYDDAAMVSVLTYNKKMTNFIATYDYQKTPRRMMFMFGTEMGKYALAAENTTERGQGVLIYPENDLGTGGGIVALGSLATYTSSMRPSARTKVNVDGYHEAGKWSSNVGTWHTMTVAVINNHCYIYLDDYGMIADYELSNYNGGYISLATTGRGASFDNLKIVDLSNVADDAIVSVEAPDDVTAVVGTDISALKLPTTVKATLKNGKTIDAPVKWTPLKYNADEVGIYQFTAVLEGNNPAQVGARLYVKVVEKIVSPTKGVKEWKFETPNELRDFKATYLKNSETGYITEGVPNWYINSSGKLTRDAFRAVNGDQYKEIAILTYKGEKYTNFELEVEYTQQWQRMMVMFGSEKAGYYIDLNDIYAESNPVAGFVEMEGVRNFIGNLINANFDSNNVEKINNARESGVRLDDYYDKVLSGGNQGKKHTMKIRVVGDKASMWVDGCKEPYVCTLTNYDGGYISLVTTSKNGSFDNLKITRLNAQGEPEATDPAAAANGSVNVSVDANASTELVVPEAQKPEDYKEIIKDKIEKSGIPMGAYVMGGSTILLSMLIGAIFILVANKKNKKEEGEK